MTKLKSENGYVYTLQYHLVWCTKYRKPLLIDKIEETLRTLLTNIAIDNGIKVLTLEIDKDHIHMLVDCTPQHYIPNFVKAFKGTSARWLFKMQPEIKKQLYGGHLWNPAYFVSTNNDTIKQQIQAYIATQKQHES
jgi:putative transposase